MPRTVTAEWGMCCPNCGDDSQLDIEATVSVRLTVDGTDADQSRNGDTEWNDRSRISCEACGWTGRVGDAERAAKPAAKYRVTVVETISSEYDVEAASDLQARQLAIAKAEEEAPPVGKPVRHLHAALATIIGAAETAPVDTAVEEGARLERAIGDGSDIG